MCLISGMEQYKDHVYSIIPLLTFQMAKQISQETFDGVVRENMEEFEMSAEEAIEDAVSQFEAQVSPVFNEMIMIKKSQLLLKGQSHKFFSFTLS